MSGGASLVLGIEITYLDGCLGLRGPTTHRLARPELRQRWQQSLSPSWKTHFICKERV
jgi:hypothetical protein